uniref:IRG-type G domain-containing protein n=1 Tax=Mustela putorius furo TaxID=9669 RepID=M3XNB9_MUSPF
TSDKTYNMGWSVLPKEVAINVEKALGGGKLLEVASVVKETLKTASSAPVNIAVTGDSGNGMSSFINALWGIGQEEEDSAPTGVVRTTQTPTRYFSSHFPNVVLWDLPGIGADTMPGNYLQEIQFSLYDLVIIIASEQFSMNLVKLAKVIRDLGKKFYIVWTKLDRDTNTRMTHEEYSGEYPGKSMCEPNIFLVSSFDPLLHDFPKLRITLHRDISDTRYHGPLENLSHTYKKAINDKVITCRKKIASKSFDTLGIWNANDLEQSLMAYHLLFGIDDESLQQLAQSMGKSIEEYRALMRSQDLFQLCFPLSLSIFLSSFLSRPHYHKNFGKLNYLFSVLSFPTKLFLEKISVFCVFPHPPMHSSMGQSLSSTSSYTKSSDLASSFDKLFKNFKPESKILFQETIALIETRLKAEDIPRVASVISDALRDIDIAPLNIVVTGEPGTGKSSFINALRRVRHDEEGAAPTGAVETTLERRAYKNPKLPNVTFWDLPGMMTTTFQPQKYLEKMKFGGYDFFIIISSTCFKINDAHLAEAIRRMKNFYFVQTKVDSDLHSAKISKPSTFNKDEILQRIRSDCVAQLENSNMGGTQVFLIPSFDLSYYDFPHLETTFLRALPAHKHHIFMQYLPNVMEAAIDPKRDSLKQKVWLEALMAGASATIPFLGFISDNDVEKLEETLTLYRSYFGLDDSSLETIAKDLHVSGETKANLTSPHLLSAEKGDELLGEKLLRYVEKFCAVTGGPIASGIYFRKIFYLQNYFLETMVSDAKVLKKQVIFKDPVDSGQSYLPQDVSENNQL